MHPLSLKYASEHYIGVERDKSIRGKVIWAGLTEDVIQYSANDVKYLKEIIKEQWKELQAKDLTTAIKVENKFVIPLAYIYIIPYLLTNLILLSRWFWSHILI